MARYHRLFWLVFAPFATFFVVAALTKNTQLITFLNNLNLVVAAMVVYTFAPLAWRIVFLRIEIDHGDILGFGIFFGWSSTVVLRAYSIVWRWMGQPEWLTDSDILNFGLFLQTYAGFLHMIAPDAIKDQVPSRMWLRHGFLFGILILICMIFGYSIERWGGMR